MITVSWTATTLGADFDRYRISRRRTETGPWDRVAEIVNEAVTAFDDYEHRWGVEEQYRVQVVNADGEISLPAETAASKPIPHHGWTIASNHSDSVEAHVLQGVSYQLPSDRQFHTPHGRDFQLSTDTGRRRGRRASFEVLVDANGIDKYQTWLDLLAEDVPYWAVTDGHGGRMFAALVPDGADDVLDTLGRLSLEAVEVAGKPVSVTLG